MSFSKCRWFRVALFGELFQIIRSAGIDGFANTCGLIDTIYRISYSVKHILKE